jgi:hypothetical protein
MNRVRTVAVVVLLWQLAATPGSSQTPAPPLRRLDANTVAIGTIRIDLARKELSVRATVNDVRVLEFVANTRDGLKAYESALTVDTDAITFNAAALLLGVDPAHARVPTRHFDPVPPAGDAVDVFVEWPIVNGVKRVRIEQLLLDRRTNQPMPEGPWVYTGSTWLRDASAERYMADTDGVLIGFVHSPAPVIENPRPGAVNAYGFVVFNERLGLKPTSACTLIVRPAAQPTNH